ncbi:MAG TPA: glycerophosphodiester phosphodiesterase family protein [Chloroflexota bacterium]|nr:glycerophosphodiester phosphodiesterase family protein [Chloroflexota bacterium]
MKLPIRPPIIVHHQAALDDGVLRVPNSLAAIQACLDAGAPFIEIDVTALADDDYLLVHDPELESETSGRGAVGQTTAADARSLSFRGTGDLKARVPFLSDVVERFLANSGQTRLQLDFKNTLPFPDDEPPRRLIRLIEPLGDRVIVSTSADWQLRKLRQLAPWLDLGLDIHFYLELPTSAAPRGPEEFPRQLGAHGYLDDHPLARARYWPTAEYLADRCAFLAGLAPGVSTFYVSHRFLARSLDDGFNWAAALHDRGIKLDAWTMDLTSAVARQNLPRLLEAGVDQITTNTPVAIGEYITGLT